MARKEEEEGGQWEGTGAAGLGRIHALSQLRWPVLHTLGWSQRGVGLPYAGPKDSVSCDRELRDMEKYPRQALKQGLGGSGML